MGITFETTVVASNVNGNISPFYIDHFFSKSNIIVSASSLTAKNTWVSAGYLSSFIEIDNKIIFLKTHKILFGNANLLEFPMMWDSNLKIPQQYRLYFDSENWLKDITLTFWTLDELKSMTRENWDLLTIQDASASQSGILSATDWITFNEKQNALGYTPLNPGNNLGDIADKLTARANLGVLSIDQTYAAIATSSSLPNLAGNSGKFLTASGASARWSTSLRTWGSTVIFGNNTLGSTGSYIGNSNTVIGDSALYSDASGASGNTAIGASAGYSLIGGNNNSFLGNISGQWLQSGINNTFLGYGSGLYKISGGTSPNIIGFDNCTYVGALTRGSASNQVNLGDSSTTTYAYGAVQSRSDIRDKADVRNTILGLDFICRLRPVDYRWDYREDYSTPAKKDGSKKRKRYHHGLISQEVKATLDELGIDFGGYQDHSIGGGEDITSIGYIELIAPILKAIQELNQTIIALQTRLNLLEANIS
jgi:hypothetical protein